MRLSSTLSVAIALVLGGVAAFLAYGVTRANQQSARPVANSVKVVVASQPLAFGVTLTSDNLREISWPADAVPEGTFPSISDLVRDGRRLSLANLQRNEPVLAAKVTAPNQRATLASQIDEGMRAVSIRVDEVRGVSGFVLPGDRVDVILTRGETAAQDSAAYADVLLQFAKVLAVDQVANERQDKPAVARAVTLEVAVVDAQKLILAQGVGRLSLVLRQPDGVNAAPARRVTALDLGGNSAAETAASPDRVAGLEKRMSELKLAIDQSAALARDAGGTRVADLEARIRDEIARSNAKRPVAPPKSVRSPDQVVNVIRNGNKSEQYTVFSEP